MRLKHEHFSLVFWTRLSLATAFVVMLPLSVDRQRRELAMLNLGLLSECAYALMFELPFVV